MIQYPKFRVRHSATLFRILLGTEIAIFQLSHLKGIFYPKIGGKLPYKTLKRILDTAVKEINEKTGMSIYYTPTKAGLVVTHITFSVATEPPTLIN